MEPIYLSPPLTSSEHASGEDNDTAGYTLALTQAVLPDNADEIARVVARSPIDRLEHAYDFDDANAYLAWSVAADAQRKAGHLGYDPANSGIEAIVVGPSASYGKLDAFFDGHHAMTDTRLVVYKQNQQAGDTPIREHFGPQHLDRFVGNPSQEQTARSAGRGFLNDLVKAYSAGSDAVRQMLDDTHHPYAVSTGFVKTRPAASSPSTTPLLEKIAEFDLPGDYKASEFHQDVNAVQSMIKDIASQAKSEADAKQYGVASQAYGFASELHDLQGHLLHGRHAQAFNTLKSLAPALPDLPYRLYEHLEHHLQSATDTASPSPGLRYTRVDIEGRARHYAVMEHKEDDEQIQIRVLTPEVETSYLVASGADAQAEQYEAACWVFDHIAERDADGQAIESYYDAISHLVAPRPRKPRK